MRKLIAALAVLALACGGSEQAAEESPEAGQQAAAAAPQAAGTGTVHSVEMLLTDAGSYVYQPATLTIKVGDTVRWLNVSGFPHNVAFWGDSVPQGAQSYLQGKFASDAQKIGPLAGRLLTQPQQSYEMTFAGAPAGTYKYFCTPHLALGMTAQLTVQP